MFDDYAGAGSVDRVSRLLSDARARDPEGLAFICAGTGRRVTFAAMDDRVSRLADGLLSLGLKRGDVVAFSGANRVEAVEFYLALARVGLIGLPFPLRASAREMTRAIVGLGAVAFVHQAGAVAALDEVRAACPNLRAFVGFGGPTTDIDYERLIAGASPELRPAGVSGGDPLFFTSTSGTTGEAKIFLLSHDACLAMTTLVDEFDLVAGAPVMTVFPLTGRVGFGWTLASISLGAPNVLADFDASNVLRLIEAHGVTAVNLVPVMGARLLAAPELAKRDLKPLRAVVYAGAPLPASQRIETEARLSRGVYEFFGMNELGMFAVSRPSDRAAKPASVGRPLRGNELRIVDDEGREVEPGGRGQLLCRTAMSARGYGDPRAPGFEPFPDGWVSTGDLGRLDADGYLYIEGRKKDVIISGGYNVGASEVEGVIAEAPEVAECAVFGLPDTAWGEKVVAVVVPREGASVDPAEIVARCRAALSPYKVPKDVRVRSEPLPRTSTAKVRKFMLAEAFK